MISLPFKIPLTIFFWWCLIIFCSLHNILTFTFPVQLKEVLGRLSCRWCLIQFLKLSHSALFTYDYSHALGWRKQGLWAECTVQTRERLGGEEPSLTSPYILPGVDFELSVVRTRNVTHGYVSSKKRLKRAIWIALTKKNIFLNHTSTIMQIWGFDPTYVFQEANFLEEKIPRGKQLLEVRNELSGARLSGNEIWRRGFIWNGFSWGKNFP